jgi:pimeloyl-ACP methyl ester carboxylesterase
MTVQGRPWTFDPAAITAPVVVVHGEEDHLVPLSHSRHTAELIPGSELRMIAGRGHLSLIDEFPTLAAELATVLR